MNARLAARYRRLLRVYPPGRRRTELLDTLIEAAPPGRRRPTARETGNLLRHGMRARLGRPGGKGIVVMAVLVAFFTGYVAAAGVSRAAWTTVPGLPTGPALAEITGTVFPGTAVDSDRSADGLFLDVMRRPTGALLLQGHDEDFEYVALDVTPEDGFLGGDERAWTYAARDRLAATGWEVRRVGPVGATTYPTGHGLWATRDGLSLELDTETNVVDTPPGDFYVAARINRFPPRYVTALGLVGWLAGALVGWLITGWVSRRTEAASGTVRSLTREPVCVALLFLTPLSVLGAVGLIAEPFRLEPPHQPFWSLTVTWGYGCAMFAVVLCLVSIVVAALGGRTVEEPVATAS